VFVRFLATHGAQWCSGRRVLELGCGTGLASVACMRYVMSYFCTTYLKYMLYMLMLIRRCVLVLCDSMWPLPSVFLCLCSYLLTIPIKNPCP
jgi:hypothetical protein